MNFDLLNELMENGMTDTMYSRLRGADWEEMCDLIEQLHLMCTDMDAFDDLMVQRG